MKEYLGESELQEHERTVRLLGLRFLRTSAGRRRTPLLRVRPPDPREDPTVPESLWTEGVPEEASLDRRHRLGLWSLLFLGLLIWPFEGMPAAEIVPLLTVLPLSCQPGLGGLLRRRVDGGWSALVPLVLLSLFSTVRLVEDAQSPS
jgi:hypothetical protein